MTARVGDEVITLQSRADPIQDATYELLLQGPFPRVAHQLLVQRGCLANILCEVMQALAPTIRLLSEGWHYYKVQTDRGSRSIHAKSVACSCGPGVICPMTARVGDEVITLQPAQSLSRTPLMSCCY